MKTVFVVEIGEKCEGGHIVGIYESKTSAIKCAEQAFEDWDWKDKRNIDEHNWVGGCDYITIFEEELKP